MTKIAQNTPLEPPTSAPNTPKSCQNAVVLLVFTLRPFFERSLPRPPEIAKMTPQVASRWPAKPHLELSWRHFGAKFGHLAAILGIPRLSKICPNRPRQPPRRFSCQDRFQDLPDCLQTSSFTIFGPFWDTFLTIFDGLSGKIRSLILKILTDFFENFFRSGGRRYSPAGRLRYPPPPRSGEPGVFKSGVQSCQILS